MTGAEPTCQQQTVDDLKDIAKGCRREIVKMVKRANAGHPGGSLSVIDLLVGLYGRTLRVSTKEPKHPDRDRVILSKGHASPAMYSALHAFGFLQETDLHTYRVYNGVCQGHVDSKWTPGIDFSGGSLGMGLSFGLGVALSGKMDEKDHFTWVILGDGECQEGEIWEAAMAAVHHKVENITVIVDVNGIQNDNFVDQQMVMGDLGAKWSAFGWKVKEIDGHDMSEIGAAIEWSKNLVGPCVILARTIKGKGVSFMENNPSFHGKAPDDDEFELAMEELA
ncbi:MAG TPA: transketolase [Candidatus Thalassarchaeaceae archaeon]|nr:transketolase [Candidatus Thalassarchaeaceae archaeon]